MSSVCTLRLNRRSAFSRGSPSCTRTSAKIDTPPNLPSTGDLQDITSSSKPHINLWENFSTHAIVCALSATNCGKIYTKSVPKRVFRRPSYTQAMLRSYQGIRPTVPASAYIDPSAQVIGDVVLGENASIWMNAVVRGDVNSIRIGANSNIQDCAVLHGMRHLYPVIVGERCTIGHNATVHGCVLEDDVLIGINAVVLNNARIGA